MPHASLHVPNKRNAVVLNLICQLSGQCMNFEACGAREKLMDRLDKANSKCSEINKLFICCCSYKLVQLTNR